MDTNRMPFSLPADSDAPAPHAQTITNSIGLKNIIDRDETLGEYIIAKGVLQQAIEHSPNAIVYAFKKGKYDLAFELISQLTYKDITGDEDTIDTYTYDLEVIIEAAFEAFQDNLSHLFEKMAQLPASIRFLCLKFPVEKVAIGPPHSDDIRDAPLFYRLMNQYPECTIDLLRGMKFKDQLTLVNEGAVFGFGHQDFWLIGNSFIDHYLNKCTNESDRLKLLITQGRNGWTLLHFCALVVFSEPEEQDFNSDEEMSLVRQRPVRVSANPVLASLVGIESAVYEKLLEMKNTDGRTPIHLFADTQSKLIPDLLCYITDLDKRFDLLEIKDYAGNTALHKVVQSLEPMDSDSIGSEHLLSLLSKLGIGVLNEFRLLTIQNDRGEIPSEEALRRVVEGNVTELVSTLIEKKEDHLTAFQIDILARRYKSLLFRALQESSCWDDQELLSEIVAGKNALGQVINKQRACCRWFQTAQTPTSRLITERIRELQSCSPQPLDLPSVK